MTLEQTLDAIKKNHPHIGNTELLEYINEAIDEFIEEIGINTGFFSTTTVADQRYYTFASDLVVDGITPATSRLYAILETFVENEHIDRWGDTVEELDTA